MQVGITESIIPNLPDEILFEIFNNHSASELCESKLVCKKWNKIITENRSILYAKLILHSFPEEFSDKASLLKKLGKCNFEFIYAELHLSKKFEWISERAKISTEKSNFSLKISESAGFWGFMSLFMINPRFFLEEFCE